MWGSGFVFRRIAGQAAFADCRAVGGAAVEQSLALGTERKSRQRWPFAGHKRQSLRIRETSATACRRRGLKRREAELGLTALLASRLKRLVESSRNVGGSGESSAFAGGKK